MRPACAPALAAHAAMTVTRGAAGAFLALLSTPCTRRRARKTYLVPARLGASSPTGRGPGLSARRRIRMRSGGRSSPDVGDLIEAAPRAAVVRGIPQGGAAVTPPRRRVPAPARRCRRAEPQGPAVCGGVRREVALARIPRGERRTGRCPPGKRARPHDELRHHRAARRARTRSPHLNRRRRAPHSRALRDHRTRHRRPRRFSRGPQDVRSGLDRRRPPPALPIRRRRPQDSPTCELRGVAAQARPGATCAADRALERSRQSRLV